MNRTTDDLEQLLALPPLSRPGAGLGSPDLDRIHRLGARRRRARRTAGVTAGALALAAVGGIAAGLDRLAPPADEQRTATAPSAPADDPRELSPLAERVLREVPGARQVSDWQVVIPGPGSAPFQGRLVPPQRVVGGPVPLGADTYAGVTAYSRADFPAWLYDGVQELEAAAAQGGAAPVGSTDSGILVRSGAAALACLVYAGGESHDGSPCAPTVLSRVGGDLYDTEWLGTEAFLRPGAAMEVFLREDYSSGAPETLAIAGLDGTEVARVEFVTAQGDVVAGSVESGTVAPGDSLFHATVPGDLARVVAYDDGGAVVEDHQIRDCSTAEDCEVR